VKASDSTAPEPGAAFRDCSDCPEMVVIPAGNFTMGSSAAEKSWAASQVGSEVLRVIKRQPDGSWKFARVIVFDEKNESVAPMSNPCT
jgi:formylglycine-generating enzyme required for sulfatase activity